MNNVLHDQHNTLRLWWIPATSSYARPKADDTKVPIVPSSPDELLTVAEACAELRISKWTLYQYIRSRQLASIKLRSRRVIPRSAIHELIERLKIEAIA